MLPKPAPASVTVTWLPVCQYSVALLSPVDSEVALVGFIDGAVPSEVLTRSVQCALPSLPAALPPAWQYTQQTYVVAFVGVFL